MQYHVMWKVVIEDDSVMTPAEAAEAALAIQRDPGTITGTYTVLAPQTGQAWEIDLAFGTQTRATPRHPS